MTWMIISIFCLSSKDVYDLLEYFLEYSSTKIAKRDDIGWPSISALREILTSLHTFHPKKHFFSHSSLRHVHLFFNNKM